MERTASAIHPDWVSDGLYPFARRFFATPPDQRMHYIDRAREPIVFVHGNPAGPSRSDSRSGSFGRSFAACYLTISASASRRSTPGVKNITPRVTRTSSLY